MAYDQLLRDRSPRAAAREYLQILQPALQQVGTDLQGRHDHGGGHRPPRASQRDSGVERIELSARKREEAECRQGRRNQDEDVAERNRQGILIVAKAEM